MVVMVGAGGGANRGLLVLRQLTLRYKAASEHRHRTTTMHLTVFGEYGACSGYQQ